MLQTIRLLHLYRHVVHWSCLLIWKFWGWEVNAECCGVELATRDVQVVDLLQGEGVACVGWGGFVDSCGGCAVGGGVGVVSADMRGLIIIRGNGDWFFLPHPTTFLLIIVILVHTKRYITYRLRPVLPLYSFIYRFIKSIAIIHLQLIQLVVISTSFSRLLLYMISRWFYGKPATNLLWSIIWMKLNLVDVGFEQLW